MKRDKKIILASCALLVVLVGWGVSKTVCISAWLRYDVVINECPDGDVHVGLNVSADGLRRGVPGRVSATAELLYAVADNTELRRAPLDVDDLEVNRRKIIANYCSGYTAVIYSSKR